MFIITNSIFGAAFCRFRCHYGVYQAAPPNCTLKKNSGDFPNCCPWPDCEPPLESDNDFRLDLDDALKTRGTNSFDEGSIKVNTISRGATHDDLRASPNINVGPSNSTSQNASFDRVDPQPASRDDSPLRPGDLKDHQETPAGVDKVVVYVVSSEKTTAEPQNATSSAADSTVTSPMVNEDALNTATTPGEGLVAAESSVDAATDCQAMCDRLRAFAAKHNSTVPECGCV